MKLLIVLALTMAVASAMPNQGKINVELDEQWEQFKTAYNKQYDSQYEFVRRLIWEANVKYIQKHNMEFDLGKHTYTLGLNEFADLTHDEFRARYLSSVRPSNRTVAATYMKPLSEGALPDTVDWRTKGYVTGVKDQGQCGSCWSFSTTGSMEGQYFRKTGTLLSFSEQQLVDCSTAYGNYGCNGGLMDSAFDYIKDQGLELESDYPYTAADGRCKYDASKVKTKLASYTDIPQGSESALQDAVANVGPISVAIDAGHNSFQLYKSGVYNEPNCSPTQLDHGVLAVGYGTVNGAAYWLVKNSWGTSWGQQGYIQMSRNKNNQCGIATMSSYPQL